MTEAAVPATESHGDGRRASAGTPEPGTRLLLVGEAPGRTPSPILSGLDRRLPLLAGLPRTNLLDRYPGPAGKGARFPLAEARLAADRLLEDYPEAALVLVGKRTALAFGFLTWAFDLFEWFADEGGRCFAVIPHPSGIVRWWNDPENRRAAEAFSREIARLDSSRAEVYGPSMHPGNLYSVPLAQAAGQDASSPGVLRSAVCAGGIE